jgi:hypothetical protein
MPEDLDHDVVALKAWLRTAWRLVAEPSITPFERRELRNYMKEAEAALRSGLRQLSVRDKARFEAERSFAARRFEFRILNLDA